MQNQKQNEGRLGEEIAENFLKKKGYKILQKNFRIKNGEADIVATDRDILVIIEVKTRISSEFGTPLEAITKWKLKSLINVAQYYKLTHSNLPDLLRIDAVAINLAYDNQVIKIEHVENISGF